MMILKGQILSMAKELLERKEVKLENTWELNDLYKDISEWENDLIKYQNLIEQIVMFEGNVGQSANNLFTVLQKFAKSEEIMSRAFCYAQRLYDQDTSNTTNQAYSAKVSTIYMEAGSKIAFIDPEIIAIPKDIIGQFYKDLPELLAFKRYIQQITRLNEHRLSTELEKLVAMTLDMRQTASDTYSLLNNADMEFPEVKTAQGETIRITHGRFVALLESSNRELRKSVFEKYYGSYKKFLNTYASLYNGQVKQQIFAAKAHKYNSTLEASVDENEVSPKVYKTLIEVVNNNLDKMHSYVSLRKRCLKVSELHMYDIYTPMIAGVAKEYTFEEAKELTVRALAPLGNDYVSKIKEGYENRWIDIYENKGKRSGAYSATAYGVHPYVLLNFNGTLDSVFTLIHEMGHSIHSYYSDAKQSFIDSQYKIFVAEVASTCNEVLLLEYMLKNTNDKKEKAYLLNHYLDMFKGTLFRQTQFAEYELLTNEMVEKGENLNSENLNNLYLELNKKYYGDDMISDEQIAYEWARIPHFYYNYYVYQYATSFAAAVAIASEILNNGAVMVPKYIEFLSSGCSADPVELLKRVGVNLETKEPIQNALNVMSRVLEELETLVEN